MGARHARNIGAYVPNARLAAVMDMDAGRSAEVAASAGALMFGDAEELIRSDAVDAVVIASPDPTHASLALACLAQGKPALVEKPLATEIADAIAIVERESAGGRRLLQVGLMRRYDPDHVAIAEAVRSGVVGRPVLFRGWHRNLPDAHPPTSRQVLVGAAVHDFDSVRWLLGQEVVEIHVRGVSIDPLRTDQWDLQIVTLTMDGGALAVVEVNKDSGFGYEVGVEITGSSGMISTPPLDSPVIRRDGELRQRVHSDWLGRVEEAYIREIQRWTAGILEGRPDGPSAWDGLQALAVALAGAASVERGSPVRLEPSPRPVLYA